MAQRLLNKRTLPGLAFSEFFRNAIEDRALETFKVALPEAFICLPDPEVEATLEVHSIGVSMVTDEPPQPDGFGADVALTIGMEIGVYRTSNNEQLLDFLDGETIKTNEGLAVLAMGRREVSPPFAAGLPQMSPNSNHYHTAIEWRVADQLGSALLVSPGTQLRITINDDITTDHVLSLIALAQGVYAR